MSDRLASGSPHVEAANDIGNSAAMQERVKQYFFNDFPKTCEPEDFWGQVKRTVNGKPVSQDQIDMIVAAVADGLDLNADDQILDLCCGNGALTTSFFARCAGGVGIDFSEYLIAIACKHFKTRPGEDFEVNDVVSYARLCVAPERFTKACCYGSLQYLSRSEVEQLLVLLGRRFTNLRKVFFGNLPDRTRIHDFFGDRYDPGVVDSPSTPIGIWWTAEELGALSDATGWVMEARRMPEEYYSAHYRFDAVLTRRADR